MRSTGTIAGWFVIVTLTSVGLVRAEWQIRPAVGVSLGQSADFPDNAPQPGGSVSKFSLGASGALIGNIFGIEADFGRRSGFFPAAKQAGAGIVLGSSVTTLTGNVTVAVPKHLVDYTLRPYFAAGAGLMAVRIDQTGTLFDVSLNMNAIDVGGGVTGFLTKRIGLNWDIRHFQNVGSSPALQGSALEPPGLSFWRANMALAIRY